MKNAIVDLPFIEYSAIEAASFSSLCDLEDAPAIAKWKREHPDDTDSDARLRGTALHCLLNEPDAFAARFCLKDFDGRTKDGKARKAEIEAKGIKPLPVDVWDAAHKSADAIRLHPIAAPVLNAAPRREKSVLWTIDGIVCKGRPDGYGESGMIFDLKSTKDAMPTRFPRFATDSRCDRQLAWYSRGLAEAGAFGASGDVWPEAWIIAVTDTEPHIVACYELTEADLCRAWDEVWPLARRWDACAKSGAWPTGTESALPFQRAKWDAANRETPIDELVF